MPPGVRLPCVPKGNGDAHFLYVSELWNALRHRVPRRRRGTSTGRARGSNAGRANGLSVLRAREPASPTCREQVLAAFPPPQAVIGAGDVTLPTPRIEGAGTVGRTAEDTVGPIAESVTAKVIRHGSIQAGAVIAAADAIKLAATPNELAERVAEYVTLRTGMMPVPDSFRLLGMRAQLSGDDNPCGVCQPLRGKLYDPNDPDAPRLPIAGCEHERGCTCRYV